MGLQRPRILQAVPRPVGDWALVAGEMERSLQHPVLGADTHAAHDAADGLAAVLVWRETQQCARRTALSMRVCHYAGVSDLRAAGFDRRRRHSVLPAHAVEV